MLSLKGEIDIKNEEFISSWKELIELENGSERFRLNEMKINFEALEIYNEDLMDLSLDLPRDKSGIILVKPKLYLKEINRKIIVKG